MTKFVLNCLQTYYAGLIEYIIIYDMPFLFNGKLNFIKKHFAIAQITVLYLSF